MRGLSRVVATIAVAGGLLAATTSAAHGQAYEPNDAFNQAYGPLVGGQNYDGQKETSNDQDWYFFNTTGQRQIDIALSVIAGGCAADVQLYDVDGNYLRQSPTAFSGGAAVHLNWTSPTRSQFALQMDISTGCPYRLKVAPADAITTQSPGLTAELATPDNDAIQRVFLDGKLMGETTGDGDRSIALGHPGPASQITFEVQNTSSDWGWDAKITDTQGRGVTTIFTERQSGSTIGRIGIVRRIVLTPSGGIISTCGEAIAPLTCFPRDSDGDGVEDNADQCSDSKGVAPTGCADADADGVPDSTDTCANTAGPGPSGCPVKQRVSASVTLKRRGSTYSGRVSSPQAGCVSGRRVVLRKVGKGTRAYGSATVSSRGTFTIRRSKRLRGRVYVALATSSGDLLICEKTASKRIRG